MDASAAAKGLVHLRRPGGMSRRFARAFTLMELMVVLFIIGLIVLILAPSLQGAREQALNTICQGNLEKLSTAIRTHGSYSSSTLPNAEGWIGAAVGGGAEPMLKCPKGYYRIVGASAAVKPNVKMIDPPMSCVFNSGIENDRLIHGWWERKNYALPSAVKVDISQPGPYSHQNMRTTATIPAGTRINSYFLHYDKVGSSSQRQETNGEVSFGTEILGIIVTDDTLDASDGLGAPGTTYHTGRNNRGYENNAEIVDFKSDRRTFEIQRWRITSPGEDTRIITKVGVPTGPNEIPGASYAMSNLVSGTVPRMSQLMLVEYDKVVADIDGEGEDDVLEAHLRYRHMGRANVLLVNGSVQLMWPDDLKADRTLWKP